MALKRILVTGISGSVGAAIGEVLARSGFDVVGIVRGAPPTGFEFQSIRGDLADPVTIAGAVAEADGTVHCASPRTNDRAEVLRLDVEGTARMLDAWRGGPFIYISSQTVYGIPEATLVETSPIRASCWYDMGKICNETQLAMSSLASPRFKRGVSLRLPLFFGARPRPQDRQYLQSITQSLRAGKHFLFPSESHFETCGSVFIGDEDLGGAVIAALRRARSGEYNVESGFCTWKTLIDTLGRLLGIEPKIRIRRFTAVQADEHRMPQSRSYYDCSKFELQTGFVSSSTLEDLLSIFVRNGGAG